RAGVVGEGAAGDGERAVVAAPERQGADADAGPGVPQEVAVRNADGDRPAEGVAGGAGDVHATDVVAAGWGDTGEMTGRTGTGPKNGERVPGLDGPVRPRTGITHGGPRRPESGG